MPDRRFITNFFSLTAARVIWRGLGAVTLIVVARHLGVETFGTYTSAYSFAAMAAVFTDIGTAQVLLRTTARKDPSLPECFGNTILVKSTLLFVVFGIMLLASVAAGHDPVLTTAIAILGGGLFFTSAHQVPVAVFQGFERMHLIGLFQAGSSVVALIGVLVAAALDGGLYPVASAQLFAALLPFPVMMVLALRMARPKPNLRGVPHLLREGVSFGLIHVLFLINQQAPVIILTSLVASREVGLFSAAYRPVALLYFLPHIVSSVLVPVLFRYGAENEDRHQDVATRLLRYLSLFGFSVSGLLFLTADQLVVLLFGAEFSDAGPILRILAWFLAMQCLSQPIGDLLTTSDRNRLRVIALATGATITVVGNILAIPIYGTTAAAAVTLTAEAAIALSAWVLATKSVRGYSVLRAIHKQVVAVGLSTGSAWALLQSSQLEGWTAVAAAVPLFLLVEILVLAALRFLQPEERRAVAALVFRRGR